MSQVDAVPLPAEPRRTSHLSGGVRLVIADLHNHSLHSDGLGDPDRAFTLMREAGLDVAALTDHASIPLKDVGRLSLAHYPDDAALATGRLAPRSLDEAAWKRTAELAVAHDVPGQFTALRGFEWTEPWLGHVNVWFSSTWTPVGTPGTLAGLFDFLGSAEPDALFGYNHPGREPGALHGYAMPGPQIPGLTYSPTDLPRRMVGLEIFNRTDDFLFGPAKAGYASPIAACLDSGWRPALIGSSDEHGRSYGLAGKGRTGLWVTEHSRAGVREALLARRAFATREVGLLLDATLDGQPLGGSLRPAVDVHPALDTVPADGAPTVDAELAVDLELTAPGSRYAGAEVELQLLCSTAALPPDAHTEPLDASGVVVLQRERAVVGAPFRCRVSIPTGARWALLRVADPGRPVPGAAPKGHPGAGWSLAYGSPWYRQV